MGAPEVFPKLSLAMERAAVAALIQFLDMDQITAKSVVGVVYDAVCHQGELERNVCSPLR